MAQTVVLAVGTAAADSDDIVVAQGETVTVTIHADGGLDIDDPACTIMQDTPTDPVGIYSLTKSEPSRSITSPGTYFVRRPSVKKSIGVITED